MADFIESASSKINAVAAKLGEPNSDTLPEQADFRILLDNAVVLLTSANCDLHEAKSAMQESDDGDDNMSTSSETSGSDASMVSFSTSESGASVNETSTQIFNKQELIDEIMSGTRVAQVVLQDFKELPLLDILNLLSAAPRTTPGRVAKSDGKYKMAGVIDWINSLNDE